jgi:hypothetical protein
VNALEEARGFGTVKKSQIRALNRPQPALPMGLGYAEGITHDNVRHGTTTLFGALDVATGGVFTECKPQTPPSGVPLVSAEARRTAEALGERTADFRHAKLIVLPQGMALIPLTDEVHVEVGSGSEADRFEKLSVPVLKWGQRISFLAPVAYIEAEFFGGVGGQSSMVWSRGLEAMAPIRSQDAINHALRFPGVQIGTARDEFDAPGPGRHRDTHDWVA